MPARQRLRTAVGQTLDSSLHLTRTIEGRWMLTADHEIAFILRESSGGRKTAHLKGSLLQATPNGLVVALHHEADNSRTTHRVTLNGRWQADANNRLTFLAERADGAQDRLTLQGGWEVGPRHELLYRYRQTAQGRRTRAERALIFEGAWDVTPEGRLVYRLAGSDTSVFEFTASLQSPSVRAAEGRLVYQLGIKLSGGRTQRQRVALFGAWKINRDLSVSFEVPYAGGRVEAIRFEAAAALTGRDRVTLELQSRRREPLGLSVMFTRRLVRDAGLFLRLRRRAEEASVIGGVNIRF